MKRIKKLAALMMAAIMVLAMSITAFADETDNGDGDANTDTDTSVTHTYEIYQIFTGDYADGVLSNIKWGENGTGTKGEKVGETVLDALEAVNVEGKSDTDKLAVIQKYANLTNPVATGSKTEYKVDPGYYLVKDQDGSLANEEGVAYTLYVVQVVDGTLTFTPKADVPTPDKKIVEGTEKVETNEASIGDEVNYEITGTMPSQIDDYKTYYYKFTDTLSKGLTYKANSIRVTVNDVDVTDYFYKGINGEKETSATIVTPGTTGTEIEVSILDVKALSLLTDPVVGAITKDTKVVLTYTATLNEDAVIAGNGNPNDVKLTYSNDPNHSGDGPKEPPKNPPKPTTTHPTGESPKKEVVTYTTELTIKKTNEAGKFLQGTEFTLTGEGVNIVLVTEETFVENADGEYWKLKDGTYTTEAPQDDVEGEDGKKVENNYADYDSTTTKYTRTTSVVAKGDGKAEVEVVGTVDVDGKVTFTGLGAGEYTITESKTLPGYNTIDPIKFNLTFNKETKKFTSDNDKVSVNAENKLDSSIVNYKGSLLPSTGGIGTTIFYVVGAILVIGAGVILVAKKRMSREV